MMRWRRIQILALCVIGLGFMPSTARALIRVGEVLTVSDLKNWGGVLDVAVVGGLAYVIAVESGPPGRGGYVPGTSSLRVIDVSNPMAPFELGAIDTPGDASGVAVVDGVAYVADGASGLRVIDVSNPAAPVEIGASDAPDGPLVSGQIDVWAEPSDDALGVAVVDGVAYVANGFAGLRLIDVSNPTAPIEIAAIDTPGLVRGVAVSGGYAYVADGDSGLRVIDVSNPEAPAEIGALDTPGRAYAVVVVNELAYVAGRSSGLRVIDISNPASPFEVGSLDAFPDANDIAVVGELAYLVASATILGDEVRPGGLMAIGVSNPASPKELGSFGVGGSTIAVAGRFAYVGGERSRGLAVIDLSNPDTPVEMGSISRWGVRDVAVADGIAYVTAGSTLEVIDVSNPAAPNLIGSVDIVGSAHGLAVQNGKAYVATRDAGLRVVDVSNGAAPVEIGALDNLGEIVALAVAGEFAYVVSWDGYRDCEIRCKTSFTETLESSFSEIGAVITSEFRFGERVASVDYTDLVPAPSWSVRAFSLRIIDISNPEAPSEIGAIETPGEARGVAVAGGFAYVADGPAGLRVIDVSNPRAPVEVGSFNIFWYSANAVALADGLAYVTGPGYGLRVIDVSNPEAPVEVGALGAGSAGCRDALVVADGLAYVGCRFFGLQLIDVSTPETPFSVAYLFLPASGVAAANGLTYVVGDYSPYCCDFAYSGLWIIDLGAEYAAGIKVDVKIHPGSDAKSINLENRGLVPVAILGAASFDIADLDVARLAFGPGGAAPAHKKGGHLEDVNDDGFMDLVSHYRTQEMGLTLGENELCVTGMMLDGTALDGCQSIQILR